MLNNQTTLKAPAMAHPKDERPSVVGALFFEGSLDPAYPLICVSARLAVASYFSIERSELPTGPATSIN